MPDIVKYRRQNRRQHDVAVTDPDHFGHDECRRPHHRWQQTAPRRRRHFDPGRKRLVVSKPLHYRNGYGAGCDDVGCRAARHCSKQRRREYRNLGRAADRPARDRRREVEKEIPAAGFLQERPEHDEQECIGCRNTYRNAKKAVGGVDVDVDKMLQGDEPVAKLTIDQVPEQVVDNEDNHDAHQKQPDGSAGYFQREKDKDRRKDELAGAQIIQQADPHGGLGNFDNEVGCAQTGKARQHPVYGRRP